MTFYFNQTVFHRYLTEPDKVSFPSSRSKLKRVQCAPGTTVFDIFSSQSS